MLLAVLVLCLDYARIMPVLKNYARFFKIMLVENMLQINVFRSNQRIRKSKFVTFNRRVFSPSLF